MKETIRQIMVASIQVKQQSIENYIDLIVKAAEMISTCISNGHKVLIFGNGGSAADAQHIAAEFINRFMIERRPLPALALTTDTSVITSIGNDYHFNDIFAKQVEALGCPEDIALGISTSGNSPNVVSAIETARRKNLLTISLTGQGGKLKQISHLTLPVDSETTARIQETHITYGHILCDLVDRSLFPEAYRQ